MNNNNNTILNIIKEIADEILLKKDDISKESDLSLFSGLSGLSVFLFHMYEFTKEVKYKEVASSFMEIAFEKINLGETYPSLCNGIAGVTWTIVYLVKQGFIDKGNLEVLDDLDDYLYSSMVNLANENNFDFLHGATGIALYFTARTSHNPKAIEYLKTFSELLRTNSIYDAESNTAKIVSKIQDGNQELIDVYNLSLAHGLSSIIIVLSKIIDLDSNNLDAKFLVEGFSNYILINEKLDKFNNGSMFPPTVDINGKEEPVDLHGSRLGWCYGDLGNGFALFHAAKAIDNKEYYQKSLEVFNNSAERKYLRKQFINDVCVCHGSAGLVDIFKTISKNFESNNFKETELFWVNKTLEFYKKKNGLKGFSMYTLYGPKYEYGILEGLSGVGLALLFHLTSKRSEWNELLLLN